MRSLSAAARRIGVAAVVLLFLAPLAPMLLGALHAPGATLSPATLWPDAPGSSAFAEAFALVPLTRALVNSALILAIALPLALALASMAGLGLVLAAARTRACLLALLVVAAAVPYPAIWLPRFLMFEAVGAVGSFAPLLAPALMGGSPVIVLLYFLAMRRVPRETIEAARMEGASLLRIWWSVALPLVRPTTVAAGMLVCALVWGNFLDPLLYLRREEQHTAPLLLHSLELLGPTHWPVLLAACLVVSAPVLLLFAAAQKFLWGPERGAGWLGR